MASLVKDGAERNGKAVNKGGRPRGSKNKSTILAEAIRGDFEKSLRTNFKAIMSVLIAEAKGGNMEAIKLLFNKAIPNAGVKEEVKDRDFGVNIVIQDMRTEVKPVEGEVIDG
jgi:hypothetical protein